MIRMIQSSKAAHAKSYFKQELEKSDYYLDDQELVGRFDGKLAARLGLGETVTKDSFYALCDNIHPITGERLTGRNLRNRTVGYDINFHCPKSVSILHALANDHHILNAFANSVRDTMRDMEADSKTRARKDRKNYHDRPTGELVWAEFIHQTARPVGDGMPDPHLHCHCFTMNATWDETEQQFKAGQFRDIKRDMPYYQAAFHKRLADNLTRAGYQVRRTQKSFEIEGVPQKVIDLFSKRTDEIGRAAKEKGITDPKELEGLGARTRSKKQKGFTMAALKQDWRRQIIALGIDDKEGHEQVRTTTEREPRLFDPRLAIEHALLHCFERASVMSERNILREAYRHALGSPGATVGQIAEALKADARIIRIREGTRIVCTTHEVLAEEKRMVELAVQAKGRFKPLYREVPIINLQGQQYEAARHVLTTTHGVSIIRGAAGAGKTTMLKEAVALIEQAGRQVTVVAPSADASRITLRSEGFENAETVARLLVDKNMQTELEGQVLLVDESGLLGTKDMTALLDLASRKNARLILVGDTRQHASVVRGDALRILNKVAGIRTAEVSRIYRQKHKEYREAVQALSEGQIKDAFDRLGRLAAIKAYDPLNADNPLVAEYVATVLGGKSALVIAPTHKEGERLTADIRARLRQSKKLGRREITIPRLIGLNYTEAQKMDKRNYRPGQAVRFNQNLKGIKRGGVWSVHAIENERVQIVSDERKILTLPLDHARNFEVYERSEIKLSKGDKIRITREGIDAKDRRLSNGQMLEVLSVRKNGPIRILNTVSKQEYSLPQNYGHVAHAHVVTSHAAQGKTVDEVFISQPATTFAATDMKQFYVSVSRGRDRVHLYTDDKAELLQRAHEIGDRQSALELVSPKDRTEVENIIRQSQPRQLAEPLRDKPREKSAPEKSRHHEREPEI